MLICLPISVYHHLQVDIGLPSEILTVLPWIGFSLGYAISTPVMAKMNRSCCACRRKTKIEWCPRVTQFVTFPSLMSAALMMLATMLLLTSHGNTTPGHDFFHPLPQICMHTKPRISITFIIPRFFHSIFNSFLIFIIRGSSCHSWLPSGDCSSF